MNRWLVFFGTIAFVIGSIWLFRTPKRTLYVVFHTPDASSPSHQSTPNKPVTTVTPRVLSAPTKRQTSHTSHPQKQLTKAFRAQARKMASLPNGDAIYGVSDGIKPHENRLPGHKCLLQTSRGTWQTFMDGTSIYRIVTSKTGALAVVTATSELHIKAPNGTLTRLQTKTGHQPQFSPSGTHLVYVHQQSMSNHTLLWHEVSTGKQIALVSRGPMNDPVVSPDGTSVIYTSSITGIASLWKTDLQGNHKQLTNIGIQPGQGRPPIGFLPTPAGRHPTLWAGEWLVFDAGGALWAVRSNGTQGIKLATGDHVPTWHIPGKSVSITEHNQPRIIPLPTGRSQP